MRALKFLKGKWHNVAIALLLLSLIGGIATPALADVIKVKAPWSISRSVTLVVAADDAPALSKAQADYVCDGTDDHVQIQAATDALPATGGKVLLTQGTFNTESSITLDSYQTFQGMGRSTILTTSTNDLTFLSATGSSGSEKIGIAIADMQIDGTTSKISNCGIYFEYVDYSTIRGIYTRRHAYTLGSQRAGIYLIYSDLNSIIDNLCEDNDYAGGGIVLVYAENNVINNNICADNNFGIDLAYEASHNVVVGNNCYGGIDGIVATYSSIANVIDANVCRSNTNGIYIEDSSHNLITNNLCYGNDEHGIFMDTANHCTISGNILTANSQSTTNTYDDIYLTASDYNNIQGNACRAGALANVPRYGINIADVACDGNLVINNDLYDDGFGSGDYNDSGTGTIYVEPGIDDTPVNGETGQPISSNWAFDHNAASTGIHGAGAETLLNTGDVGTMAAETATDYLAIADLENPPIEDEASAAPTSEWAFDHDADGTAHQSNVITITLIIDGGGSAITTGEKGHLEIPFACTITGWTLLGDQSGSIVIDVWNDTYANFPPAVADTIAGSEKPTLSSVQKNQDLALGTWTTAVGAGDILAFNVDSVATVERVTLSIRATKT